MQGETLKGPLPVETALNYAKQIADALEAAHEKGIVHRDLKPANIMIAPAGVVKVLDFGLAKGTDESSASGDPSNSPTLTMSPTRAGMIMGTAAYMSPEQARGRPVDKRADIWAFGVVLYEMLTGHQAFTGETITDVLAAVVTKEPDLTRVLVKVRRLLQSCLQKDPKLRLQAIGDWRLALDQALPEAVQLPVRKRLLPWAVGGVLALVSLVLGALLWRATRPVSQPLVRLSVELPEFAVTPVSEPGPGVIQSPDGRRIVYTGRGTDGTFRLYTRLLDQDQAAPLAGTEGAYGPFLSPDGQAVGFFAGGKLKKTSVERGGAVVLCDASTPLGGSWGEDGYIVAALTFGSGLSRVPVGGGTVQPVTELEPERKVYGQYWPQVLPTAQAVLFTAPIRSGSWDESTIEAKSLRTGEGRTLIRGGYYGRYVPSGRLLYVHQGTLYAAPMDLRRLKLTGSAVPVLEDVVSSRSGFAQVDFSRNGMLVYVRGKAARHTLVWLDSAGQTKALRTTPAQYSGPVRFSPDGKRLAVVLMEGGNTNVWVYEWERDTITRLTFARYDSWPVWSTDGKHIAFSSTRDGGGPNLYWMRADGAGEAVRLTESKNPQLAYSVAPDGKRLAFYEVSPQTGPDLWTLPLEEVQSDHPKAGKPQPFLVTPANEASPMISPDGRWLAYQSDESGRNEVYVRRFPGPGGKWQISTEGGERPTWSRKKSELFYRSGEGVMVTSYAANGEALVPGKSRLWVAKKDVGEYFGLAPDGERFAMAQEEGFEKYGSAHVTFLLNFFDELRRKVPLSGK